MKPSLLLTFLCVCFFYQGNAQGFSGVYAAGNWTPFVSPDDPSGIPFTSVNTGSITPTGTTEITLNGSDDPDGNEAFIDMDVDFTIMAAGTGLWEFDWEYISTDASGDAQWDQAIVLINGVPTALSGTAPTDFLTQADHFSISVSTGDVIGFRVKSIANVDGGATLRIFNFVAPIGALPVTLNIFNAKQSGEQVKLDWSTASEANSNYFDVERSTNGKDFKKIASVTASGNSALTQNYSAIDNNPENGNNYYRLKQVDLDGKYVYSMIKTLKWASLELIKIYPNPARTNITVRLTPDRNETTSISLFDGSGRMLQRRNIAAVAGSNLITDWNVQALAPGIYYFRINNQPTPLRFVKQ